MCKTRLVKRLWYSSRPWLGVALLILILVPFDGWLSRLAQALAQVLAQTLPLGGELQRELDVLQQYGGPAAIVIGAAVVWLLDPGRRRRLLDWLAAIGATAILVVVMKLTVGRVRPKFNDPLAFLGPFGTYPIGARVGVRHAWEFWNGISSDLWSMPSSHAAYAVVMSVFLSSMYPRFRPLAISLATLVGVCRILLGAHYPSDVVAGAALGYFAAQRAIAGRWGERLWQWGWQSASVTRLDHHRDEQTLPRTV